MIPVPSNTKVGIAAGVTDMRKGFNSLAGLGARTHRRPQDQSSRRAFALELRCAGSVTRTKRSSPDHLHRTVTAWAAFNPYDFKWRTCLERAN